MGKGDEGLNAGPAPPRPLIRGLPTLALGLQGGTAPNISRIFRRHLSERGSSAWSYRQDEIISSIRPASRAMWTRRATGSRPPGAGDRPLIEDFLDGKTDLDRPMLLQHLLGLELDYRGALGEAPGPSEYQHRFPGHVGLIDSVFAEFAQGSKVVRGRDLETGTRTEWDRPRSESGSAASPPSDFFPGIPGIEILSELGRGGMGVVYKARQTRLNRLCALKMLLLDEPTGAELRARFLAEAETIARLRHPNIVQIYGLGDHNGRPYFEMEYIEGGSLARRLDGTPWAPETAARMVAVLARAIGDAHRLGIVHRDLKPANVLLVDADTPKIVDFGLAKTLEADSNLTQSGVFYGTPSYAAPEQVEGLAKTVGPAADIYALGAIFYRLLTGRAPFQAATAFQTLEQVKTADPVPPSRLQPGLSRDAETICLKCLEKDPRGVTPMPRHWPMISTVSSPGGRSWLGRQAQWSIHGNGPGAGRRWPFFPRRWWQSPSWASSWSPGNGGARKPRLPGRPPPMKGRNRQAWSRLRNRPSSHYIRRWLCVTKARWDAASCGWTAAWSWPPKPSPRAFTDPSASTWPIGQAN